MTISQWNIKALRSFGARLAIPLLLLSLIAYPASPVARDHGRDLETVVPEEVGWSSRELAEAAQYAEQLGFSALVLVHDGKVFFSWGDVEKNFRCHSIRKPFLSALYGIYVDNKTIDLDLTM